MKITTLPGLIDVHVHMREPGATHKEDFLTGTSAALAGGFTTVIDMPNNATPITSLARLEGKIELVKAKTVADVGLYFGSLGDNLKEFPHVVDTVFGIKLYLNETTGNFLIDEEKLKTIYKAWPDTRPIFVHAEQNAVGMVIKIVRETGKRTHFAHVSSPTDLQEIIKAKEEGLPVTCGVTPHHLFLTTKDKEKRGPYAIMKPPLVTPDDVKFLWEHLDAFDVIESDHAPHTKEEKENSEKPPFGVPGLETTLPLLLTAVSQGKLTLERVIELCHTNPAKIFNVPVDDTTYVEVDLDDEYTFENINIKSKCGWYPFTGMKMRGRVKKVVLRGATVFENGEVIAKAGSGRFISPK